MSGHPWRLVGPWYRWPRPGDPAAGRRSPPVLQKYGSADFVDEFLANPQRSLRFDEQDLVVRGERGGPPPAGTRRGALSDVRRVVTDTRKLFLPLHGRFYLVVCELHCDVPGFPSTARDQVCRAGFVVRRRHLSYPVEAAPAAAGLLRRIGESSARIAGLERTVRQARERVGAVAGTVVARASRGASAVGETVAASAVVVARGAEARLEEALAAERGELAAAREAATRELLAWKGAVGAHWVTEGWVPVPGREGGGRWAVMADTPEVVTEQVFPLTPLVPAPTARRHAGRGRTIWFGLVPTTSGDHDEAGVARFDPSSLYEIRCFVQRKGPKGDACCEVTWSDPTEPFQLAAPFDPVGTSLRPLTVHLPDLPALAAEASARGFGALAPVRMVQPAGSALRFRIQGGVPKQGSIPDLPAICCFSIPLITIVASFVLNLFLPIVVLLFNLFFMLRLKFCIPPGVSLGVVAGLEAQLASLEAQLAAGVDLEALDTSAVRSQIKALLDSAYDAEVDGARLGSRLIGAGAKDANLSTAALIGTTRELATDFADTGPPAPVAPEWEAEVPVPWA